MAIVADQYDFLIGVDTHAASHTLALITAGTGAVGQQAQFPTSPSGLRRAVDWIQRHTHQTPTLIVIDGGAVRRLGRASRSRGALICTGPLALLSLSRFVRMDSRRGLAVVPAGQQRLLSGNSRVA